MFSSNVRATTGDGTALHSLPSLPIQECWA